jgi:hypothetical protein
MTGTTLQLHARIRRRELPVSFGVRLVPVCLPGGHLPGQRLLVGDTPVED